MTRRIIAAGGGLLVLILLILAVRGCLDARKEQAYKDYVQDVSSIVQESDQQGRAFFGLLSAGGGRDEAVDVENRLNGFRVQSAALVDRAQDTDHPEELDSAHRYLVETLEFRRDGLAQVANALPAALGDQERREGTDRVTAQMQNFLTSDVIYSQRFVPNLNEELDKENLQDEVRIPRSQFLPDIDWLEPGFVADRVSGVRTGSDREAEPGLHGTGVGSVTLGGQALPAGGTASVQLSDDLQFQVQVANQGEHTETDVTVRINVGRGGQAIELEEQLDTIAAGETKTVNVPLAEKPPTGQPQPVEVEIEGVPGEEKTDNNKQSATVTFTE